MGGRCSRTVHEHVHEEMFTNRSRTVREQAFTSRSQTVHEHVHEQTFTNRSRTNVHAQFTNSVHKHYEQRSQTTVHEFANTVYNSPRNDYQEQGEHIMANISDTTLKKLCWKKRFNDDDKIKSNTS